MQKHNTNNVKILDRIGQRPELTASVVEHNTPGSLNKFPDFFFVWALLLIVNTLNSSPLRSNLFRVQCTCSTVPTNSGRLHGSPLV